MDPIFFTRKVKRLISIRNLLMALLIIMSCALIRVSSLVSKLEERIVVIPPTGNAYWIGKNNTSKEYLQEMGLYFASLLVDRTPLDVDFKNEKLLEHVHLDSYYTIKKQLEEEAKAIKAKDHTFHFIRQKSEADRKRLTFTLWGIQRMYLPRNKKGVFLKEERMSYQLLFTLDAGRLFLTSIKKEENDEPV